MNTAQDRLSIIKAIEGASDAELEQLTLIRHALQNMSQHPGGLNAPSSSPNLSVKRSLIRSQNEASSKIKSDSRGNKSPYERDKRKQINPYNESLRNSGALKGDKGKKNPFIGDNKSPKNNYGSNGSLNKDKKERVRGPSGIGESQSGAREASRKTKNKSENSSPGRDANGRFQSKSAAADFAEARSRKNSERAEEKRQQSFFRTLTNVLGESVSHNSDAMSSGADLAGTAAGGPLWMAGKGLYDIASEVGSNVVTLKSWMNNRTAGNTALKTEPAISFPPVNAKANAAPALGKPRSAAEFGEAQQARSVAVTEAQTKVIAANDDKIIKGIGDLREEMRKLAHAAGGSGGGGLLDSLLPGRRNRRQKNRNGGRKRGFLSTAADAVDIADDLTPDGKNKAGDKDAKKKPAGKKKGLFGKALDVLKGGKKAATVAGAAAATAATGAVVADAVSDKATEAATAGASKKAAEATAEKSTEKAGLKVAGKVAGKTALKAIPLIGAALGVGLDAYDGYTDEEGQRATFGVKDGEQVSGTQKAAYTSANVVNMGGLVSGASGMLASGASALGMNGLAKSLTFDTGDIAKGIDSGLGKVGDMFSAFTTSATGVYDKLTGTSTDQTKAIKDGTDKTVGAINQLGTQLQGGDWGKDGVGNQGKTVADYADVSKNNIGADLNIGGDKAKVRSFRNNNFGNLNFAGQEGASLEATPGNGKARFAKFNTPEEGFRGLANQLSLYSEGKSKAAGYKKLNTIDDIISLYAPKSENNTGQYIDSLSKKMGVKSDEQLNLKDPKVMTQLMRGIATIEGGNPQVTNDWIQKAIGQNENGKWVGGQLSDESLKAVNEARAKNGEAPIAADSLYTAGSKIKLAQTGATGAPAAPAKPTEQKQPVPIPEVNPGAATNPAGGNAAAAIAAAERGQETPQQATPKTGLSSQIAAVAKSKAEEFAGSSVVDKIKNGASAAWEFTKRKNLQADQLISNAAQSAGVEGMSNRHATSGLSLPAGASLPAGLQLASLSPDQIAARSRPIATPDATFGSVQARPASATASAIPRQMVDGVPVFDASETNKARLVDGTQATAAQASPKEGNGLFDRVMGGAMSGMKAVGASVMPAVGDTFSQALGGFSGSDMISGVMQQAGLSDPGLMRAVSPITSKAGGWLDSGVSSIASAGKSLLSGGSQATAQAPMQQPLMSHPKQMKDVTDLARSGVRPMMNGDNGKHDPDMLKEMKRLTGLFEEMLGITKKKSDSAPDKVVNTSQPAPRPSSTLSVSDPALNDILQD